MSISINLTYKKGRLEQCKAITGKAAVLFSEGRRVLGILWVAPCGEDLALMTLRGKQPCWHLDLGLPASRTVRK